MLSRVACAMVDVAVVAPGGWTMMVIRHKVISSPKFLKVLNFPAVRGLSFLYFTQAFSVLKAFALLWPLSRSFM